MLYVYVEGALWRGPRDEPGADMSKPVIFTISATWDDEASVWSGHCDDIPAAAGAPTVDELLAKISVMALDRLPDNHLHIDPASIYLHITASREAGRLSPNVTPKFDELLCADFALSK
jgi:hypothetical protein